MPKVPSYDPDVMVFKRGGGWLTLFGLPFLVSGIFVMILPFFLDIKYQGEAPPWYALVIFGGVFTIAGAAFVFGRAGVIIDRRLGILTKWWGLIFAWKSNHYDLKKFQLVSITKERRQGKNNSYTVYPISLKGENLTVSIEEDQSYISQRKLAEELAKFIGVPMEDSTAGESIVRKPEELDISIKEKLQQKGDVPKLPPIPKDTKLIYTLEEKQVEVEVPPKGWTWFLKAKMAFTILIVGITILYFTFHVAQVFKDANIRMLFLVVAILMGSIPVFVIGISSFYQAKKKTIICISPQQLSVTEKWGIIQKTVEFNIDEIEELKIIGAPHIEGGAEIPPILKTLLSFQTILIRSDRATLHLGQGLTIEELKWLMALIENMIYLSS